MTKRGVRPTNKQKERQTNKKTSMERQRRPIQDLGSGPLTKLCPKLLLSLKLLIVVSNKAFFVLIKVPAYKFSELFVKGTVPNAISCEIYRYYVQ